MIVVIVMGILGASVVYVLRQKRGSAALNKGPPRPLSSGTSGRMITLNAVFEAPPTGQDQNVCVGTTSGGYEPFTSDKTVSSCAPHAVSCDNQYARLQPSGTVARTDSNVYEVLKRPPAVPDNGISQYATLKTPGTIDKTHPRVGNHEYDVLKRPSSGRATGSQYASVEPAARQGIRNDAYAM